MNDEGTGSGEGVTSRDELYSEYDPRSVSNRADGRRDGEAGETIVPSISRRRLLEAGVGVAGMAALAGCSRPPDVDTFPEGLGADGNVIYVGESRSGRIDPSTTPTPLQDAISEIDRGSNQAGIVFLPAGRISEAGPITNLMGKTVIGCGIARGDAGQHGTTVVIDGGGDGISPSDRANTASWTYLHNFSLRAHDRSDGRAAIRFDGSNHYRQMNIGSMKFVDWTNTESQRNPGVIDFQSNQIFSSRWEFVTFQECSGPSIRSDGGKPYGLTVGTLNSAPRSAAPALCVSARVNMDVQHVQTGGHTDRVFEGTINGHGFLRIGSVICEPTQNFVHQSEVFDVSGEGPFIVGACAVLNPAGYDQIYKLDSDNGRNQLPKPSLLGSTTVENNVLNVTSRPIEASYYYGPGSDVQTDVGSNTGLVRSMATAGTGHA